MIKKKPTGIDSRPQRWIMGIVNGRVQLIHMIGPCALVITPEEISKIILMTEWVGDELADKIRSALDER